MKSCSVTCAIARSSMIRYSPPKSQIWGHQVGRLSATAIVDRCTQFLSDKCTIIYSQPSELMVGWNSTLHPLLSELAVEIDQVLGQPTAINELPSADGELFRQHRWQFSLDYLPAVATWFDRLAKPMKTQDVVAQSITYVMFAWQDEPPPLLPMQSAGGTFGIHLGVPHRITTMFSFRDVNRYQSIKGYLSQIELVELSDKHVRPKMSAGGSK
ncbi:MAG: hypothetical protein JWP89_4003 [Schlesneria sp.]|nr:hypothetical protein [Schlesneria sp.]